MQNTLHISRIYAIAIFDFCIQNKSLENWKKKLLQLSKVIQNKKINKFFNIIYSKNIILNIFFIIYNNKIDNYFKNFIKLLIINQRLHLIHHILKQFLKLYNNYHNIMDVKLISTYQLTDDQKKNICVILEKKFHKKINLIIKINTSILYGYILNYHNIIIDNCILNRFQELSNFLIL
ncbi:ATP synthase F1 subunit delta [Buchnera aphidicola]|uniref:ATP synthase subunit delta n=1 Tax=Buchnera aphidicola (Therioaphis trifolii) TaxID=1241884 RepID=A0A4D6YML6_9GAMM|nr:ATP synthase F1 subunit delta [Buchnera aphidicola]QCI27018.1 ATP synthase F1 subunit delta [Buchnera aphidicola (Therioaphis trifolii)]